MIDVGRTYCTKSIHFKQLFQDLTKITIVIFMHSLSLSMLDYNGSCLLL